MSQFDDLIRSKADALDSIPDNLFGAIEKAQKDVYKRIIKVLDTLELENGKIVLSGANLAKIEQVAGLTQQVLFEGEYIRSVRDFAKQIDVQSEVSQLFLDKTFGFFEDSDLYDQVLKQSKRNVVSLLNEEAVNQSLIEPLRKNLLENITSKATFTDTIEQVQQIVLGDATKESNLLGNRKTLVKDAFAVSDREYLNIISSQYDFEFYKYAGGNVEDSRCFCQKRSGKVWHIKEIQAWGAKKELGDCKTETGWQGMNKNTNSATIFSYVGGYNCNHVLSPMPTPLVPPSAIKKAKEKGYL